MPKAITYFRRYRMQIDLVEGILEPPSPEGYHFLQWDPKLVAAHAESKFRSFRNELDANVFRCLGNSDGCYRLMKEVSSRDNFIPEATWLARFKHPRTGRVENCGTIQGLRTKPDVASIQNVGVVASHRGNQVGAGIMLRSLHGFHSVGVRFVSLEVTVHNSKAIRFYKRLGFRVLKTVYKSAEVLYV